LIDERSAFLVGSYITGLGAMAFLWFLGNVRDYLRTRGAGELTAAASAGGVFAITLMVPGGRPGRAAAGQEVRRITREQSCVVQGQVGLDDGFTVKVYHRGLTHELVLAG